MIPVLRRLWQGDKAGVQGYSGVHNKLKVNLSYIVRPWLELGGWGQTEKEGKREEGGSRAGKLAQVKMSSVKPTLPPLPVLLVHATLYYCTVISRFCEYWVLYLLEALKSMNVR